MMFLMPLLWRVENRSEFLCQAGDIKQMAYRKTRATEERKQARRRLILDAATRLFGKYGYHATTVPQIVEEAKVSTGSFYMYFRNKEDVFNAALEELGRATDRVLDKVKQSQPDLLKRIAQGAESLFLFFAQNTEQVEELRQMFEAAPSLFTVEDTSIAAQCVAGATFEAIYSWLKEDPKTRIRVAEVARAVARFNTQAVSKKPAKREANSLTRVGSRKGR
jgi:TetR/AcrR family transcriptional regulator, fatty acid metabolism regulator protein